MYSAHRRLPIGERYPATACSDRLPSTVAAVLAFDAKARCVGKRHASRDRQWPSRIEEEMRPAAKELYGSHVMLARVSGSGLPMPVAGHSLRPCDCRAVAAVPASAPAYGRRARPGSQHPALRSLDADFAPPSMAALVSNAGSRARAAPRCLFS